MGTMVFIPLIFCEAGGKEKANPNGEDHLSVFLSVVDVENKIFRGQVETECPTK